MGLLNLFGGDSESSQATNNNDNSKAFSSSLGVGGDLLQLAPQITTGEGSIGTLQLSDYGAIAGAQDLLKTGLSDIVNTASKQTAQASEAVKDALGLAQKNSATDSQTLGDTIGSVVKWVALAVAAAWVSKAVFGFFKKS